MQPEKINAETTSFRSPNDIMREFINDEEIAHICGLLNSYQKSGVGWDEWRAKHWINDWSLESKWENVLRTCRLNGYINPHADGDRIRWRQVSAALMVIEDDGNINQCILCPLKQDDCKGTKKINIYGQKIFTPCWKDEAKDKTGDRLATTMPFKRTRIDQNESFELM